MIKNEISEVRDKLINIALAAFTTLAIPALGASVLRTINTGWLPLYSFQVCFVVLTALMFIFKKRLPYSFKAHVLIIVAITIGLLGAYNNGLVGGTVFLISGVFLSALFFGKRIGFLYMVISVSLLAVIAYLYISGIKTSTIGEIDFFRAPLNWLTKITGVSLALFILIHSFGKFYELFEKVILDLKLKTATLKESNDSLEKILDFLPAPIAISNNKDEIVFLNKAFESTFGYKHADLKTLKCWYVKAYPDDKERATNIQKWNDSLGSIKSDKKILLGQNHITTASGEVKIVLLYRRDLPDKILVSFIDITTQIKNEKLLNAQKNQLIVKNSEFLAMNQKYVVVNEELSDSNKAIKIINSQLELAKAKAEESDRLKTAFLCNMSHEIRTPMNGILGFTQLLRIPDVTDEKRDSYIDIIHKSGNQLMQIVNDILDISKIETGQIVVSKNNVNINQLMHELYVFYNKDNFDKNISIAYDTELDDNQSWVITDNIKLYQILENIINNAIKFTNEGLVSFGYYKTKRGMLFYVKDTGIGIDKKFHEIIFERFNQAIYNNGNISSGTGLGLSISKAYVEMLGGVINLESELGVGSKFTFELPIKFLVNNKA